jgi:hypothetical protein
METERNKKEKPQKALLFRHNRKRRAVLFAIRYNYSSA